MVRTRVFSLFLLYMSLIINCPILNAVEQPRPSSTEQILSIASGAVLTFAIGYFLKNYEIEKQSKELDRILPLREKELQIRSEELQIKNKELTIEFLNSEERCAQTHYNTLKMLVGEKDKYCNEQSPYKNDVMCTEAKKMLINYAETMNNKDHTITIIK